MYSNQSISFLKIPLKQCTPKAQENIIYHYLIKIHVPVVRKILKTCLFFEEFSQRRIQETWVGGGKIQKILPRVKYRQGVLSPSPQFVGDYAIRNTPNCRGLRLRCAYRRNRRYYYHQFSLFFKYFLFWDLFWTDNENGLRKNLAYPLIKVWFKALSNSALKDSAKIS